MEKNRIEIPDEIVQPETVKENAWSTSGQGEAGTGSNDNGGNVQTPTASKENETTGQQSQSPEAKKETRGRKPLSEEEKEKRRKEKEQKGAGGGGTGSGAGAQGSASPPDAKTDLLNDLSKYKTVNGNNTQQPSQQPAQEKIDISKFVSGALMLIVMDAIIPGVIIFTMRFVDKKYKYLEVKKIKLSSEEKKELEPFADEVVKIIFIKVNPVVGFFVVSAILYGSKLMFLTDEDFNLPKEEKKSTPSNGKKK